MCYYCEPPGSLVGSDLDSHLCGPAHAGGLSPEPRAKADGVIRGLLRTEHAWIVARLVALVSHKVEHRFDWSIDDNLALYAGYARFLPLHSMPTKPLPSRALVVWGDETHQCNYKVVGFTSLWWLIPFTYHFNIGPTIYPFTHVCSSQSASTFIFFIDS